MGGLGRLTLFLRAGPGQHPRVTTVLLLHGPGRSTRSLQPLAARLRALGHRVLAPALPPEVRAAAAAARAWLPPEPVVVVGVAGGHRAAVALAHAVPQAVSLLVLCSPSAPTPQVARHVAAVVRTSLREVPSLKPQLLREDLRPGLGRRVRALREALAQPLDVTGLDVPVVAVVGDRDGAQHLPVRRRVVVRGGAHELHWSAPHVVARVVDGLAAGGDGAVPRRRTLVTQHIHDLLAQECRLWHVLARERRRAHGLLAHACGAPLRHAVSPGPPRPVLPLTAARPA